MQRPFSVYCTWGLHDELGDRVELSGALAGSALETLARWRQDLGLTYDFFVLDCFWFDPEKGYLHFKRPHWPDGFEPLRDRILALGMRPGLWYSTNGGCLHVPAWEPSRTGDNGNYSLVDGPYADLFEAALHYAAREWQVRFFKFDFADFHAAAMGVTRPRQETYRRSVERFVAILRGLRSAFSDIYCILHCGFARGEPDGDRVGTPDGPTVDPSLLAACDAVFSGDPHPFDVPQTHLVRNLDLYQDRQVWRLHQTGFPLHRIEDHGIIIATTNTCCYRGRAGVRRTHLGQLARGGRRDLFYGNPALLSDEDARAMLRTRSLFFDAFARDLTTQFVGAGEPGTVPWHGYLTGGGNAGLLYLVNATLTPQHISQIVPGVFAAAPLYWSGVERPNIQTQPDVLSISLAPEQAVLIGLGAYASDTAALGGDNDPPTPRQATLLPLTFVPTDTGLTATYADQPPAGAHLHVVVRVLDAGVHGMPTALPHRFARQNTRTSDDMRPAAHSYVRITANADGRALTPVARIPDVPVWSGISWVAATFAAEPCEITVTQHFEQPKRLVATAYLLFGHQG
jgi:hypothetical protein